MSLLLLAVALVAALYSNSSARNGYVSGAVVGALLALVVALWVAWRFVPRLASAVDWHWLPRGSRTLVTREGWVTLGSLVIVGATALNTSNNLLYMIFAALTALILLSVVLAAINLRSVAVTIRIPAECFVRENFPMTITLQNAKAVFPAFSIRAQPGEQSPFRFSGSYFPMVGTRDQQSVTLETACSRRGHHRVDTVRIESRFPFGLFVKSGGFPVSGECIAFPEIRETDLPSGWSPDLVGISEYLQKGHGTDLYMIRDYLSTDSARRVDWKASAKTARLKTREFTREETRRIVLVFDRYGRPGDEAVFEQLVSRAASLASMLAGSEGHNIEVGFVSDEWTSGFASSDESLRPILRYLAFVTMTPSASRTHNPHGGETVFLSLR